MFGSFKRKLAALFCTALMIVPAAAMSGCHSNGGQTAASSGVSQAAATKKVAGKIALICSAAGPNDNGYNQSAIDGLKQVKKDLGIDYKVVQSSDIPGSLTSLAQAGYKVIFSLEYNFDALIKGVGGQKAIADQFPDTTFVVFNDNPNKNSDGTPIHKNVISVMFNVNESSFLAGALSVLVNENASTLFNSGDYSFTQGDAGRKIAFIGGTKSNGITVFSYGYASGANYEAKKLNKNYTCYTYYDAGFTDSAAGATKANTFFTSGANVIFSSAGSVGDGVDSKAKEVKKLSIEVDANKDASYPGHILTSVIKNTKVPVYTIAKYFSDGQIASYGGKELTYDLKSGATSVTDLAQIGSKVTASGKDEWTKIQAELKDVAAKIGSGEIKVVNAQNGEKFDKSALTNVTMPND